jgi:hypothetical protein
MGLPDWYTVLHAAHGCAGRKRPHKDCKQIRPLFDRELRPRFGAFLFRTCKDSARQPALTIFTMQTLHLHDTNINNRQSFEIFLQ